MRLEKFSAAIMARRRRLLIAGISRLTRRPVIEAAWVSEDRKLDAHDMRRIMPAGGQSFNRSFWDQPEERACAHCHQVAAGILPAPWSLDIFC
jgi:hypothetical protein